MQIKVAAIKQKAGNEGLHLINIKGLKQIMLFSPLLRFLCSKAFPRTSVRGALNALRLSLRL